MNVFSLSRCRVTSLACLLLALVLVMSCRGPVSPGSQNPDPASQTGGETPAATALGQRSLSIDIVARKNAFSMTQISVPSGALLTVNFRNEDVGVQHNFAVYERLPTRQTTSPVYIGSMITGVASIIYRFTTPSTPGIYFFECDNHSQLMNGQFIVTP